MANKLKFCSIVLSSKLSLFSTQMESREVIGAMTHKVLTWTEFIQSLIPFVIQLSMQWKRPFCTSTPNRNCTFMLISMAMQPNADASSSETQSRAKRPKFSRFYFQSFLVLTVWTLTWMHATSMTTKTTRKTKRETQEPLVEGPQFSEKQAVGMFHSALL